MSGPKVVRVKTKQEVISICQGRLDTLRDAINEWQEYAKHHGDLTEDELKEKETRFSSIVQMFELEQFAEVQKHCTIELGYIQQDIHKIQERAIVKAEKVRSFRRRLQYSAETLIADFEATGHIIPSELKKISKSAALVNESELKSMESTLSKILTEHSINLANDHTRSQLQNELVMKLIDGETTQTLTEWKMENIEGTRISETRDHRLDKLLAEVEALEGKDNGQPFLERLNVIENELSMNHSALLMDSLILDLIAHSNARKENEKAISRMREIRSELRQFSSTAAQELVDHLTIAINTANISNSKMLCQRGEEIIKEETQRMAGIARRKAILRGLAELGYEVKEDLSTAWVKDGRIVVQKPHDNTYGVELGAVADAERVQVQLVTFEFTDDPLKASRDRYKETIWCSEFSHLSALLEKSGTIIEIEKALPLGAKPLKYVKQPFNGVIKDKKSRNSTASQKNERNVD